MAEDELLFEIELEGVDRQLEIDEGSAGETFDVRFTCSRPDCSMEVRVSFDVKTVTTLEVVPRAMAEMHRAFTHAAAVTAPLLHSSMVAMTSTGTGLTPFSQR